jgi:prepilin-type N-terminal cleavage/methylation domain-containing protein
LCKKPAVGERNPSLTPHFRKEGKTLVNIIKKYDCFGLKLIMLDRKDGFSLIELIVTITIIMVISSIGAFSFQGANKKGRDSRRVADLERIRMGLELYKQNNGGVYPGALPTLTPNYLGELPTDPRKGAYIYSRVTNYTYTLDTALEVGTTTGSYGTCGSFTCNYRVTNP